MARVGGRNTAMSWIVGVLCVAVVGGLLWLAIPLLPMIGETLQGILP